MWVSFHLLGITIETLTCEISILFTVLYWYFLAGQLKPGLCLVSSHLEQVISLLLAWKCDFTCASRGLKESLASGSLLSCCFWLEGTWD